MPIAGRSPRHSRRRNCRKVSAPGRGTRRNRTLLVSSRRRDSHCGVARLFWGRGGRRDRGAYRLSARAQDRSAWAPPQDRAWRRARRDHRREHAAPRVGFIVASHPLRLAPIAGSCCSGKSSAVSNSSLAAGSIRHSAPSSLSAAGGTAVEIERDLVFRPAPLDPETARDMFGFLRVSRRFDGVRGGKPRDTEALVAAIVRFGLLADALAESGAEIEINPLIMLAEGEGVCAVDARLTLRASAASLGSTGMPSTETRELPFWRSMMFVPANVAEVCGQGAYPRGGRDRARPRGQHRAQTTRTRRGVWSRRPRRSAPSPAPTFSCASTVRSSSRSATSKRSSRRSSKR